MKAINWFEIMADADRLKRVETMLNARAAWTLAADGCEPASVEERVDALLRFTEQRMIKDSQGETNE